ncbi:unnamed protein product [Polarella glacialis]|uniref:SET domain-containing protein n=1 Tax=Polarella glacialis TaxID=89957 RepID=A0A813IA28_POLGL|nr:unnamed protein product [Polarella glacialis]
MEIPHQPELVRLKMAGRRLVFPGIISLALVSSLALLPSFCPAFCGCVLSVAGYGSSRQLQDRKLRRGRSMATARLAEQQQQQQNFQPALCWRTASDGCLGVFAEVAIAAGTLVERCYCLPLRPSAVPGEELRQWLYDRGLAGDEPLLFPLGWGLLYNEAPAGEANTDWDFELARHTSGQQELNYINLQAKVDIAAGEELCISRSSRSSSSSRKKRDILSLAIQAHEAQSDLQMPPLAGTNPDSNPDVPDGILSSSRFNDVTEMRVSPLHGNGVYARRDISKGEVVEIAPNLLTDRWQLGHCLIDHRFDAGPSLGEAAARDAAVRPFGLKIALGLGSIFNHDEDPNLGYRSASTTGCLKAQQVMKCYYARRDITAGEELFISYGPGWWKSRNPETVSLAEWRFRRGETKFGLPFYDHQEFAAQSSLSAAVVEKLHRAFVDAEGAETGVLEVWKQLCEELRDKANIQGCINTPLRETGERATHRAAMLGQVQKLRWLVLNGADVNAATAPALDMCADGSASSALCPAHVAAIYGQIEAMSVLQSAGADLNCRRTDGATPLDFAKDAEQSEAVAWITLRGGLHGIL